MSVTEDAPAAPARRSPVRRPGSARRASPWWWLVTASALVLVLVAAVMGAWWAATRETRITTYRVVGTLSGVELDLGAAPVEIAGGAGGAVEVRRTEDYAFGQPAAGDAHRGGRRPEDRVALPGDRLRDVPGELPDRDPRQRAGEHPHVDRAGSGRRPQRLGADLDRFRRHRGRRLLRLHGDRDLGVGRRAAPAPTARRTASSSGRPPGTCAPSSRRAATASTCTATRGPSASVV